MASSESVETPKGNWVEQARCAREDYFMDKERERLNKISEEAEAVHKLAMEKARKEGAIELVITLPRDEVKAKLEEQGYIFEDIPGLVSTGHKLVWFVEEKEEEKDDEKKKEKKEKKEKKRLNKRVIKKLSTSDE